MNKFYSVCCSKNHSMVHKYWPSLSDLKQLFNYNLLLLHSHALLSKESELVREMNEFHGHY